MKLTKLLLLIAFCCTTCFGLAQKSKPELFVLAGPNLNHFYGTDGNPYPDSYVGFSVGAGLKKAVSNQINLSAGLSFDRIGAAANDITLLYGNTLATADVYHLPDYLSLPLLAEISTGNKVKLKFETGIFVGMLLNYHVKFKMKQGQQNDYDIKSDDLKNFNGGLLAGIGTEIPLSKKLKLQLVLRDQFGLISLYKESDNPAIKTNSLNLLTGISFSL
jgi:hypothetical protein